MTSEVAEAMTGRDGGRTLAYDHLFSAVKPLFMLRAPGLELVTWHNLIATEAGKASLLGDLETTVHRS